MTVVAKIFMNKKESLTKICFATRVENIIFEKTKKRNLFKKKNYIIKKLNILVTNKNIVIIINDKYKMTESFYRCR